ncbi:MAG: hypothetical protein ACOCVG_02920, partial [Verrucomicrobiota bacterium]
MRAVFRLILLAGLVLGWSQLGAGTLTSKELNRFRLGGIGNVPPPVFPDKQVLSHDLFTCYIVINHEDVALSVLPSSNDFPETLLTPVAQSMA